MSALTLYAPEQMDLIRRTIAIGCTDDELSLFANICKKTGLDPFMKQIYPIKRKQYDQEAKGYIEKMTIQTSIDGYRVIAERSGKYAGQNGPWWCGKDGIWKDVWCGDEAPYAAKVEVVRSDFTTPLVGIAKWSEYVARKSDGSVMGLWVKLPTTMLAKCAESLALRKAFPNDIGELRTEEEMDQADSPPLKISSVTGEIKKKKPTWSPEQHQHVGGLIADIYSLGGKAGEDDVASMRKTMAYDEPADVIEAFEKRVAYWRDINAESAGAAP